MSSPKKKPSKPKPTKPSKPKAKKSGGGGTPPKSPATAACGPGGGSGGGYVTEYVHRWTKKLMRAADYGYKAWPFGYGRGR